MSPLGVPASEALVVDCTESLEELRKSLLFTLDFRPCPAVQEFRSLLVQQIKLAEGRWGLALQIRKNAYEGGGPDVDTLFAAYDANLARASALADQLETITLGDALDG